MSPASQIFSNGLSSFGLSFAGRMMKLETAADAEDISLQIENCNDLRFLSFDGNSIGIGAAKRIGEALKGHSEFTRAKWNNMFTSRSKEEIPEALNYLFNGIIESSAELIELDLSDNAFGPIGVRSLAKFLSSKACFKLQELRLNNNGLGPEGARMLAKALDQCYINSGHKLALQVFIAGRNRLENEGIHSLSEVFQMLGSLKEISIPQNGIYYKGISDLCSTLRRNKNVKILNVSDNTVRKKGAGSLSRVIPVLSSLEVLNLGDCLLGNDGAILISKSLKHIKSLKELNFEHNEISLKGGISIIRAVSCMINLKHVNLNGNMFGDTGISSITSESKTLGVLDALGSFSEDEGSASCSEEEDVSSEEDAELGYTAYEANIDEASGNELNLPISSQMSNMNLMGEGDAVTICSRDERTASDVDDENLLSEEDTESGDTVHEAKIEQCHGDGEVLNKELQIPLSSQISTTNLKGDDEEKETFTVLRPSPVRPTEAKGHSQVLLPTSPKSMSTFESSLSEFSAFRRTGAGRNGFNNQQKNASDDRSTIVEAQNLQTNPQAALQMTPLRPVLTQVNPFEKRTPSTSQQSVALTTQKPVSSNTQSTTTRLLTTPELEIMASNPAIHIFTTSETQNHAKIMDFINEVNNKYTKYKRFLSAMAYVSEFCCTRRNPEVFVGLRLAVLLFRSYFAFAAELNETMLATDHLLSKAGLKKNESGYSPGEQKKQFRIRLLRFICGCEDVLPPHVHRIVKHMLDFPPEMN